ncbi:hypothetical protein CXB51_014344 [Gossypium anomalum]|uniref:Uncharacterized protein n=1 Tax=Gossypium anomalum TaxID=47600 RepID=A0A8J6D176_9ROSI|nr:hypothetical protein CXB51_014344 [Gossypium anomalum]
MQSLCSLMSTIGSLVRFSITGVFVHLIGPKGVLGLLTILAALVLSVKIVLFKCHVPNIAFKVVSQKILNAGSMWMTLKCPQVWQPCLYIYLSFVVSFNINEGFLSESIGYIFSIGRFSRDTRFDSGVKNKFEIRDIDYLFIVIGEIISQMIGRLKWMPLLVLVGKLCPSAIEGTFFALLMSIDNVGLLSSSLGEGFGHRRHLLCLVDFENLWLVILIQNVLRLSSLWILFLVPRGDPVSSILPIEMLSSKDETETKAEAKESNNIELVSLVNSVDGR